MKAHFRSRGTPLMAVDSYPSTLDQERRLRSAGVPFARATILTDILKWHLGGTDLDLRQRWLYTCLTYNID